MEKNVIQVAESKDLREGAQALIQRSIDSAKMMLKNNCTEELVRGGRKAHILKDFKK